MSELSEAVERLQAEVNRHDPDKRPFTNADIRLALDALEEARHMAGAWETACGEVETQRDALREALRTIAAMHHGYNLATYAPNPEHHGDCAVCAAARALLAEQAPV